MLYESGGIPSNNQSLNSYMAEKFLYNGGWGKEVNTINKYKMLLGAKKSFQRRKGEGFIMQILPLGGDREGQYGSLIGSDQKF